MVWAVVCAPGESIARLGSGWKTVNRLRFVGRSAKVAEPFILERRWNSEERQRNVSRSLAKLEPRIHVNDEEEG
jgi:hypothetical protein